MKKLLLAFALCVFVLGASAQVNLNMLSVFSLTSDTVTNTGTVTLTSARVPALGGLNTLVYVSITKISGTVGGTLTLMGSVDGTNFKALTTIETQTALATITAADASSTYGWRLNGNHYPYYRVSYTGTGTMAASFTAKTLTR
jgi:hypothetical protein